MSVYTDHMVTGANAPAYRNFSEGRPSSGVSWIPIFAGAVAAATLSLVLLLLGTVLSFSSTSPWGNRGVTTAMNGIATIVWLTFTQLAASGMGGYLAGRLRTKWAEVHTGEAFFRDTAHGFLAWAVATLLTAALLASAVSPVIGAGAQTGAKVVGGAASAAARAGAGAAGAAGASDNSSGPMSYFVDSLFRRGVTAAPASSTGATDSTTLAASSGPDRSNAQAATEVSRIFLNSIRAGALPADDAKYVNQVVAQRTGLSQPEAEKRVNDTYTNAQTTLRNAEQKTKEAADAARKASAYGAVWLVISMLIGASIASYAATYGDRGRDF